MRPSTDDIAEFLARYPRMSLQPSTDGTMLLEGRFDFNAAPPDGPAIEDSYTVRIDVGYAERLSPPVAWETGCRIQRTQDNHVNYDGTLCLGSPLRLGIAVGRTPSLCRFTDACLVPFLYAATLRARGETGFRFGELDHGTPGMLADYENILGVKGRHTVEAALQLLCLRRRVSNKQPCACGCGKRLGKCRLHERLNWLRPLMPRAHFAQHLEHFRNSVG